MDGISSQGDRSKFINVYVLKIYYLLCNKPISSIYQLLKDALSNLLTFCQYFVGFRNIHREFFDIYPLACHHKTVDILQASQI